MTRLSVNINKIATLRNARGGNVPDILHAAIRCQEFGAEGITVHPRPDERHIRYADVLNLKKLVTTEFNIEGYPADDFIALVLSVKPEQVTLVPDPPDALTSNAGWDTIKEAYFLKEVISRFHQAGIRTSIFTGTEPEIIEAAAMSGTDRIELYTEPYAAFYETDREMAIAPFANAAQIAKRIGIGVNAGHDLSLDNLEYFVKHLPNLLEVSIGHALISDALYLGLEKTIAAYLQKIKAGKSI